MPQFTFYPSLSQGNLTCADPDTTASGDVNFDLSALGESWTLVAATVNYRVYNAPGSTTDFTSGDVTDPYGTTSHGLIAAGESLDVAVVWSGAGLTFLSACAGEPLASLGNADWTFLPSDPGASWQAELGVVSLVLDMYECTPIPQPYYALPNP